MPSSVKTPGAFPPLRVGGADGERAGVRCRSLRQKAQPAQRNCRGRGFSLSQRLTLTGEYNPSLQTQSIRLIFVPLGGHSYRGIFSRFHFRCGLVRLGPPVSDLISLQLFEVSYISCGSCISWLKMVFPVSPLAILAPWRFKPGSRS